MSKGASLTRQQRRGKLDQFGKPLRKRPYNNKKRTKGRKLQADVQGHYKAIMDRVKYLKLVAHKAREAGESPTEENWKEVFRKYDEHKLIYGPYEKLIMMNITNK